MDMLKEIAELSREFGTDDYVKGGGGNASAKDAGTMWIKPSGTTAGQVTPESLVALDRGKIDRLRKARLPAGAAAREAYKNAGIKTRLKIDPPPNRETVQSITRLLRKLIDKDIAAFVCADGRFTVADGPISPDHIVYMKSRPLVAEPTQKTISAFIEKNGYAPRVVSCSAGVFGLGTAESQSRLALTLAQDGALVKQLADAFGGVHI